MTPRYFTLDEANAMLPWLAETFSAVMPVREELVQEQERLLVMLRSGRENGASSHGTEVAELQRKAARWRQRPQPQSARPARSKVESAYLAS